MNRLSIASAGIQRLNALHGHQCVALRRRTGIAAQYKRRIVAIVQHGESGFLAATPQEWFDALTRLRRDPQLRLELGMAGRRVVGKQHCVQVTARALAEALYAAAGRA
jgi:glycosyltransferase involved in cell wall biosynthesis